MILRAETRQAVLDAAGALRQVRGRSTMDERKALGRAIAAAEREIEEAVRREYPGLLGWRRPAPSIYDRWVGDECRRWRSAAQLARAAERWLDEGPATAAARVAQAYGLGATLGGESNPRLALRDYGIEG